MVEVYDACAAENRRPAGQSDDFRSDQILRCRTKAGELVHRFPRCRPELTTQFQKVTGLKCDTNGMVLELTDPKLKQQPFIYISEGGQMHLKPEEAKSLRAYLLGGGFLMVDDFWGENGSLSTSRALTAS